MDLDLYYPSLSDLARRARARVPRFVWEYFDSGTGDDRARDRSSTALDAVVLMPEVLKGAPTPDLSTEFLGRLYAMPAGIAPVGMSGLIRPGAERDLARTAARLSIPYCLSTVAAMTPEAVGPHTGGMGWFQLYAPGEPEVRRDMLKRAKDAGFHTMILTADVPVASRRERQRRAEIRQPPVITPSIFLQCLFRPAWSVAFLSAGRPSLVTLEKYADTRTARPGTAHIGYQIRTAPDEDYLKALRDEWDGPLVVKGILDPRGAERALALGADALWVSNHGGRQFDAAPGAIEALPEVRGAVGPEVPIAFDGGIRSGTDILRALALGADLTFLGRAPHHGLAAFGPRGVEHVFHILAETMKADMGQMAISRPADARHRVKPVAE